MSDQEILIDKAAHLLLEMRPHDFRFAKDLKLEAYKQEIRETLQVQAAIRLAGGIVERRAP